MSQTLRVNDILYFELRQYAIFEKMINSGKLPESMINDFNDLKIKIKKHALMIGYKIKT